MIEIGENLKLKQFQLRNIGEKILELGDYSGKIVTVNIQDIVKIEISGISKNSEFRGTMDWGMSNPTVILPTTIIYNIISLFKNKRKEIVLHKFTLLGGLQYIVYCDREGSDRLLRINTGKS